ncbi:hypothetical protein ZIOFF_002680 [Zingiber officinale]|uniref:Serine acetyltransferase N-terminal domain-containing protein n=1 Tax=Zingiber officinale TaxID=94328 RepID=A0A8J5LZB4_ZINOF|nr:hypothetical protein ZIOFF_002680 [Zingiber officinale]
MPCEVMSARLRRSCCPNSALVDGARSLVVDAPGLCHYVAVDDVWVRIQDEARGDAEEEPLLRKLYCDLVLAHPTLESALAAHLAAKLAVPVLVPHAAIHDLLLSAFSGDAGILRAVRADLRARELLVAENQDKQQIDSRSFSSRMVDDGHSRDWQKLQRSTA